MIRDAIDLLFVIAEVSSAVLIFALVFAGRAVIGESRMSESFEFSPPSGLDAQGITSGTLP